MCRGWISTIYKLSKAAFVVTCCMFAVACSVLQNNFQEPSIKLVDVRQVAGNGLEQRFDINLRVTNPNARALNLVGMSYVIELEGFKVVNGAANNIPGIPAYGDALVTVQASIGLLEGAKLLASLVNKNTSTISYNITAKLDTGLPLVGVLPVSNSGAISLSN